MHEIFIIVTRISKNVPATSDYFQWFSEDFQTLLKMSVDVSILKLFKDDNFAFVIHLGHKANIKHFLEHFQEMGIEFLLLHCTYG